MLRERDRAQFGGHKRRCAREGLSLRKRFEVIRRQNCTIFWFSSRLQAHSRFDPVANCVGICWRCSEQHDVIGSSGEINDVISGLFGESFPAVDPSHCDLPGRQERPEKRTIRISVYGLSG